MIVQTMSRMMETLSPTSVNGTRPERPKSSHGQAQAVYEQMRSEFFVAGPFVLHGEVPPLLAGAWSLVRETLFTGEVLRGDKEIVAWAVSQSNECSFCEDAHGAARSAAGADDDVLERWAKASSSAASMAGIVIPPAVRTSPAEFFGTLTAFHYLNRMVSIFLDDKMMPMPDLLDGVTRSMARFMMGGMIDKAATMEPGRSLPLMDAQDPSMAWRPDWAEGSTSVAAAIAGWSATIEAEAARRFDSVLLERLRSRFDHWQGTSGLGSLSDGALPGDDADSPLTRLAVLTAEAPYRVTAEHTDAAIEASSTADTLVIVAWAAQRAARRCCEWTVTAAERT